MTTIGTRAFLAMVAALALAVLPVRAEDRASASPQRRVGPTR